LALGLALARPDLRVVAVDGDGAALMRMGVFATLGTYGPSNLTHVLLDNGAHESTGGQATVSRHVSFAGVAAACGYASAVEGDTLDVLDGLPRPTVTPVEVKTRLMRHIGAAQAEAHAEGAH
ncbi:thiamine pyrophosphate-dependent enzyme, partial [Burkholderia gladioli]|uniref:thiamine pyrophosphate-dependent enzyme n=1 Tax=Burkholderia gladioli TaxID=28095 RepID=UPI001FC81238